MMRRDRFDRWFRAEEHARREIDAEIDAHLQSRIDYLTARGMSPDDARFEAVRRFGDVRSAREALFAQADARRRRLELRERCGRLGQDLRFAARSLTASRAFTLGVVATFALGLGVNAAVFRITDQVLFRPPAGVAAAKDVRRVEAGVRIGNAAPMRATTFSFADARRVGEGGAFAAASAYTVPRLLPGVGIRAADQRGRDRKLHRARRGGHAPCGPARGARGSGRHTARGVNAR